MALEYKIEIDLHADEITYGKWYSFKPFTVSIDSLDKFKLELYKILDKYIINYQNYFKLYVHQNTISILLLYKHLKNDYKIICRLDKHLLYEYIKLDILNVTKVEDKYD